MSSISDQLFALYNELNSLAALDASSFDTCESEQAEENKRIYEELQNKINDHLDEWIVGLNGSDMTFIRLIGAIFTKVTKYFNHPNRFNEYITKMNYYIDLLENYANSREN